MNVVFIGSGMYVCGRGTDGYGTILPAVFEYIRSGEVVNKVTIVGTNGNNASAILEKVNNLQRYTGISCEIEIFPEEDVIDKNYYAKVLKKIEKELNWMPNESFETGILKTILWYLEHQDWWQEIQEKFMNKKD